MYYTFFTPAANGMMPTGLPLLTDASLNPPAPTPHDILDIYMGNRSMNHIRSHVRYFNGHVIDETFSFREYFDPIPSGISTVIQSPDVLDCEELVFLINLIPIGLGGGMVGGAYQGPLMPIFPAGPPPNFMAPNMIPQPPPIMRAPVQPMAPRVNFMGIRAQAQQQRGAPMPIPPPGGVQRPVAAHQPNRFQGQQQLGVRPPHPQPQALPGVAVIGPIRGYQERHARRHQDRRQHPPGVTRQPAAAAGAAPPNPGPAP